MNDKIYTLKWEGTKPERATRQEMLVQMWTAKILGVHCYSYTAHDPGRVHAKDMEFQNFPAPKTVLHDLIMCKLALHEAENCAGILREALSGLSIEVEAEKSSPDFIVRVETENGAKVELRVSTKFGLRRPSHTYDIGTDTGEDFDHSATTHVTQDALSKFCELVGRQYFSCKIKHILSGED